MSSKEVLRKCKWCKKPFTVISERKTNAIKYCCDNCRKNAKREQDLRAQQKFQLKYKWLFKHSDPKGRLGESMIGPTPEPDWQKEYELVHRELKRRLKL